MGAQINRLRWVGKMGKSRVKHMGKKLEKGENIHISLERKCEKIGGNWRKLMMI